MRQPRGASISAALCGFALAGCNAPQEHTFGGYPFDVAGDCLESPSIVDVIAGPDLGPCNQVRCWVSPGGDAYVTTTSCDGPLDFSDRTGDAPGTLCAHAILAYDATGHSPCPADTDGGDDAGM